MKAFFIIAALLLPFSAQAEITGIKITSFTRIGGLEVRSPYLGEVCGHVEGDERAIVHVVADPNRAPGSYMTLTSDKGHFCVVVANYTGQVTATATALHKHGGDHGGDHGKHSVTTTSKLTGSR